MRPSAKVGLFVASGVALTGVFLLLRRRPQVPSGSVNVCELTPPTPKAPTSKRRLLTQSEVTADMTAQAVAILQTYRTDPIGTEIPFQSGGRQYYGRIEWHCGKPGPWHRGVSLFA